MHVANMRVKVNFTIANKCERNEAHYVRQFNILASDYCELCINNHSVNGYDAETRFKFWLIDWPRKIVYVAQLSPNIFLPPFYNQFFNLVLYIHVVIHYIWKQNNIVHTYTYILNN